MSTCTVEFDSRSTSIDQIITQIVADEELHGRWLNTLSYMENCGARQMAACEHPTLVKEEMLKHAAEEFRHAYFFKCQIAKVCKLEFESYQVDQLLGGYASLHYLPLLDLRICRYLKHSCGLQGGALREAAYALVSYAIERRAEELYPCYQGHLERIGLPLSIKGIIREEAHHLEEMIELIDELPDGWKHAEAACMIEGEICDRWINNLIENFPVNSSNS